MLQKAACICNVLGAKDHIFTIMCQYSIIVQSLWTVVKESYKWLTINRSLKLYYLLKVSVCSLQPVGKNRISFVYQFNFFPALNLHGLANEWKTNNPCGINLQGVILYNYIKHTSIMFHSIKTMTMLIPKKGHFILYPPLPHWQDFLKGYESHLWGGCSSMNISEGIRGTTENLGYLEGGGGGIIALGLWPHGATFGGLYVWTCMMSFDILYCINIMEWPQTGWLAIIFLHVCCKLLCQHMIWM